MFYEQYAQLCKSINKKPSAVARELGFSSAAPGRWKNGAVPNSETLRGIADYFGVPTDYLLYGSERNQNITNSAVVQQNTNSSVKVENMHGVSAATGELETELLNIFEKLSFKDKINLLQTAYELNEQAEEL